MWLLFKSARIKMIPLNRNGFTFLTAIFMVMIMGILLSLTGQSWKTIMKREREKELLFRGSQIKEAIENWYNPNYSVEGVKWNGPPHQLMELKDLLKNPYTLTPLRYLPQTYETKLDGKNPKCGSDCADLKIDQDPMTGKKWVLIKGNKGPDGSFTVNPGGGIIGVASSSEEEPLKSDFKGTALENMGPSGVGAVLGTTQTVAPLGGVGTTSTPPSAPSKMTKYSEWEFKAESPQKNDHSKIYRAYHEGW